MVVDTDKRSAEAHSLLLELRALLDQEGETNWRRGIGAAVALLSDEQGNVSPRGFEEARSIYRSMNAGGRGFAEYYIEGSSDAERIQANARLDELRSKLWTLFD